jgi:hypothetical protein
MICYIIYIKSMPLTKVYIRIIAIISSYNNSISTRRLILLKAFIVICLL